MTTARTRALDVLVLDMSTIRFQWAPDQRTCAALTPRGELLAVYTLEAPAMDSRELAFALLDAALDQGQVLRPDPADPTARVAYQVALYNPFTAEVAVAAIPETVTFTDGDPVALPVDGLPARAQLGVRSASLDLGGGRVLAPRQLSFAALTRTHIAHQAA